MIASEFLGREEEFADARERARRPGVRLLTLTGPGGTGKTRFALQLAAELAGEFPDGVRWVPLATIRDSALVASAVAEKLDERMARSADRGRGPAAAVRAARVRPRERSGCAGCRSLGAGGRARSPAGYV